MSKRPAWPKQEEYGAKIKKICLLCQKEIEQGEWYDYVKPKSGRPEYVHHDCLRGGKR